MLAFVIKLTPYAVLAIISVSTSKIFSSGDSIIQLLILVGLIYLVALVHTFIANGLLVKLFAKISPFKFFKAIFPAQATAFTTQSSIGTLPVTIKNLEDLGVDEEVSNFTAPLGTTIGMPGCTCIWPILLAIFYVNAVGLNWGVGDYIILAILTLVLSFGSAGVPGIAIVSSISLFSVLGLPVAAVILLMPINTISDMIRTVDNVSTAATAGIIVGNSVVLDEKVEEKEVIVNDKPFDIDLSKLDSLNKKDDDLINEDQVCGISKKKSISESLINEDQACSISLKKKKSEDSIISEDQVCSFSPRKKAVSK